MDVFAKAAAASRTQETVAALVEMLRAIEMQPAVLLEVVLQGPFNWRRKVRRTSAQFLAIDDSVLNKCFDRLEQVLDVRLLEDAKALQALHGKAISPEKALDLAVQAMGTHLQEKETERREEDALFDLAEAPRPGLTLLERAEKLPLEPRNAGMATDQAKL